MYRFPVFLLFQPDDSFDRLAVRFAEWNTGQRLRDRIHECDASVTISCDYAVNNTFQSG